MAAKALNANVVVSIEDAKTTLANGMSVQEQRGKKDVVKGIVRISGVPDVIPEGSYVWFPYYAALPVMYGGEYLHCVRYEDVIIVED